MSQTTDQQQQPGALRAAGAELDALVHTTVWGVEINCSHGIMCSDILPYSTDLEAAWTVVERAIDYQFFSCGMPDHSLPISESQDHRHSAELWFGERGGDRTRYGKAVAETLPLAVCRAALAAALHEQAEDVKP